MQWLQAAVMIFYADFFHASLLTAYGGPEYELATYLSLAGVLALGVGMRVGLLLTPRSDDSQLSETSLNVGVTLAFLAYMGSFLVSIMAALIAGKIPGLSQFLLNFTSLKWVFVFVLAYAVLEQKRGYSLLIFCAALEVGFGLIGFFSGFKNVFFVIVVAALTSPRALHRERIFPMLALFVALLISGSAWSAVKGEYREFLNKGFQTQEVLVPIDERFSKLGDLITTFDGQQLVQGFDAMVLRLGYVEYFALTIGNVPEKIPYENGALWGSAIRYPFMPRMFFPNKPILDDSERTSVYTGIEVTSAEQGASIGIGYFW